jgi:hypothetical protein
MRRPVTLILVSLGALAASATLASAHNTPYSWTVAKARVALQEETNVAMPADQRAALDAELAAWLAKFRPLLLTAQAGAQLGLDPRAGRLAQTYDSYIERLKKLRVIVNSGLSIESAKCAGQGKAVVGKFAEKAGGAVERQYKHFRCNATSYTLEMLTIELDPGADPSLPEVIEGPRRIIGPLQAVFTVHVRGKTRMLAQRAG